MGFKVIFSETFRDDLAEIIRRIARDNPEAAIRFGDLVLDLAESLQTFPERFPFVRRSERFRRLVAGNNHVVFYEVNYETQVVDVLRLWDGRRGSMPRL